MLSGDSVIGSFQTDSFQINSRFLFKPMIDLCYLFVCLFVCFHQKVLVCLSEGFFGTITNSKYILYFRPRTSMIHITGTTSQSQSDKF